MTSTQVAPQVSIQTRYSGKYGAMTMTSSPGLVTACSEIEMDAAAPQVRYRSAAVAASSPKRRHSESASLSRTQGRPLAGV